MTTFGTILGKLFGSSPTAAATPDAAAPLSAASPATPANTSTTSAPSAAAPQVDVHQVLQALSATSGERLDWKNSIVDLLKLLGLDSSLASRQTLARELGYTGDPDDSAGMNTWLQAEVLKRLAANGGQVPTELKG